MLLTVGLCLIAFGLCLLTARELWLASKLSGAVPVSPPPLAETIEGRGALVTDYVRVGRCTHMVNGLRRCEGNVGHAGAHASYIDRLLDSARDDAPSLGAKERALAAALEQLPDDKDEESALPDLSFDDDDAVTQPTLPSIPAAPVMAEDEEDSPRLHSCGVYKMGVSRDTSGVVLVVDLPPTSGGEADTELIMRIPPELARKLAARLLVHADGVESSWGRRGEGELRCGR